MIWTKHIFTSPYHTKLDVFVYICNRKIMMYIRAYVGI